MYMNFEDPHIQALLTKVKQLTILSLFAALYHGDDR